MYCSTVCIYIYVSLHLTIFFQFGALDMIIIYHNVTMSQCKQEPCIENTIQNTMSQCKQEPCIENTIQNTMSQCKQEPCIENTTQNTMSQCKQEPCIENTIQNTMSQCKQEPCTYLLASDDTELSRIVCQRQSFSFLGKRTTSAWDFLSCLLSFIPWLTRPGLQKYTYLGKSGPNTTSPSGKSGPNTTNLLGQSGPNTTDLSG